jgi:hypothetical protein
VGPSLAFLASGHGRAEGGEVKMKEKASDQERVKKAAEAGGLFKESGDWHRFFYTAPVGIKSTAQAKYYTSPSCQVTTSGQRDRHLLRGRHPLGTPIGCTVRILQDFLKRRYLQHIRNEYTVTKGEDQLKWEEVQMRLPKHKSNQQKH